MEKLKEEFLKNLSLRLKPMGFKFSKPKQGFIKKTSYGQLWYTFLFYKYPNIDGFEINPVMQIRFKLIEDLFHKTSSFNQADQKGTSTIGCSIENHLGDLTNESFRKRIINKENVLTASNFFYNLFEKAVNPFFDKYDSLESLNKLINEDPKKDLSLINSIFRGSKGLIIAKLLESENFNTLLDIYSTYYKNYYDGFYKPDFDKVVDTIASPL